MQSRKFEREPQSIQTEPPLAESVYRHKRLLDANLILDLATRENLYNESAPKPLSPRECEVLILYGQGLERSQVANALGIALTTVKKFSNRIFSKLRASCQLEAIIKAADLGEINLADCVSPQANLNGVYDLTTSQTELLDSMLEDQAHKSSNKQLARKLSLSTYTIKNRFSRIYPKLNVTNRTSAATAYLYTKQAFLDQ